MKLTTNEQIVIAQSLIYRKLELKERMKKLDSYDITDIDDLEELKEKYSYELLNIVSALEKFPTEIQAGELS